VASSAARFGMAAGSAAMAAGGKAMDYGKQQY